nr:putative integron gene cassette protein [uncultured bacterium]
MKLSLEIGDSEKHSVEFSWNQLIGRARLRIDGHLQSDSIRLESPWEPASASSRGDSAETWEVFGRRIQLVERWRARVGTSEPHELLIEKTRPRWLAGLRPHTVRVFLDKKLIHERSGF